ncbi:Conserved oligomeric Golgi complex subunit 6 [Nymphon striatum]|nr:Conserved oligomeric Golgi complex subunit 6 [Nymphon striatum]
MNSKVWLKGPEFMWEDCWSDKAVKQKRTQEFSCENLEDIQPNVLLSKVNDPPVVPFHRFGSFLKPPRVVSWVNRFVFDCRNRNKPKCGKLKLEEIDEKKKDDVKNLLGHITEGICRPLKVRLEQVIVSEPGAVILYKISNLLKFYHHTIKEEIPSNSSLLLTLLELQTLSHKMFINSLVLSTTKLVEKVELPPADLGPTEALKHSLTLLKDVLACHDSAVVSLDDKQKDFSQILSSIIDPLLQMCHVSASKLSTSDMATYMINSVYLIHSTLALYEFTDSRLEMLHEEIEAHLHTLTSEQASFVISHVAMGAIYKTISEHQPKKGRLSDMPGMDLLAIKTAMTKFDSFLSSPDSLLLPQAGLIISSTLRQALKKRSLNLTQSSYAVVFEAIANPESGYDDPLSLMHRTPDQVKALLVT